MAGKDPNFIGPLKADDEKDEEESGYVYNQATNTFASVGNVSTGTGMSSVNKPGNIPTVKNVDSKQAVVVTNDNSVIINRGALGEKDKLTVGSGKTVAKKGDQKNNLAMFGDGTYLEKNLYTLEKEDKGRKDNYEKTFTTEQLKEEQKKLREYNKEKAEKVAYCNADGDTVEELQGPIWRKTDGDNGLIYSIYDVIHSPSMISFEGYLLYEKPIDIDKYIKSVDTLGTSIDTPVKKVKVNTEAFVTNTTTANDNSIFDDETKAERNKINQAISNVEETGRIKDRLIKDLESKKEEFKVFNDNLRFLKRGTKLKMLLELRKQINKEKKILKETTTIESYSSWPKMTRDDVRINDYQNTKYELKHHFTKKIEPEPGTNGFTRYTYQIKVIARTYLDISKKGLPDDVSWDNRDSFQGQIETLERRINEAGRGYLIPYKNRNIVDMDDKSGEWYYDK